MALKPVLSKTLLLFILSLCLFLLLRLWNISGFLYFIYDQGRDATRLAELAQGSLAIVGPTTGIEGLFLGPLWYYAGLPGYLLSNGNPAGIAAWFICLSAFAFPGFWWISREIFKNPQGGSGDRENIISQLLSWVCLALFIVLPASIISSTTIWNCLMGAPLMVAALYCFWRVRSDKHKILWLAGGFFAVALTLQSEFAYAVFFLPVLFVQITWFTGRKKIKDFVAAAIAVTVTLIPQFVFEVRHQFIMSTSLLRTLLDHTQTVSWETQISRRPLQLVDITVDMFNNPDVNSWTTRTLIVTMLFLGATTVLNLRQHGSVSSKTPPQTYLKQLVLLFAVIPYPFYLLWRGNGGNFFSYYLTSHFVFLIPLFVLGMKCIADAFWKYAFGKIMTAVLFIAILLPLLLGSISHWTNAIGSPVNQAGILEMQAAVREAYQLRDTERTATLIITPNIHSTHYDYLFHYYADQHQLSPPITIVSPDDKQLILVIERNGPLFSDYVVAQRKALTEETEWRKKRVKFFGVITVEEWVR